MYIRQYVLEKTVVADPVATLPPEIFARVLGYLDTNSLFSCRAASNSWNMAVVTNDVLCARVIESTGIIGTSKRAQVLSKCTSNSPDHATTLGEEAVAAARIRADIFREGIPRLERPVEVVDAFSERCQRKLRAHEDGVILHAAFCSEDPTLFVTCGQRMVKVWRTWLHSGELRSELVHQVECEGSTVAELSTKRNLLAIGTRTGVLHLICMTTKNLIASLNAHACRILRVIFDGGSIITASGAGSVKSTIIEKSPSGSPIFETKSLRNLSTHSALIDIKLVGDVIALGRSCAHQCCIDFFQRDAREEWILARTLRVDPFDSFDLSPGRLIVQSITGLITVSWPLSEPLTQATPIEAVHVDESDYERRRNLHFEYCIGRKRCSRLVLVETEGEWENASSPKGSVVFKDARGIGMEVTCMASNRHGLVVFGGLNGRVVLGSLLKSSDLLAGGWGLIDDEMMNCESSEAQPSSRKRPRTEEPATDFPADDTATQAKRPRAELPPRLR
ncbi:hypothetical protein HDU96_004175 [Phlyctochytrium bullatum]|nr:hypothetical protein HDU96_004175 [Phlyctochytrium bullatum]